MVARQKRDVAGSTKFHDGAKLQVILDIQSIILLDYLYNKKPGLFHSRALSITASLIMILTLQNMTRAPKQDHGCFTGQFTGQLGCDRRRQ